MPLLKTMSTDDFELIAAGFTAILGFQVVHGQAGQNLPKLTINKLFQSTYIPRTLENVPEGEAFEIHVKTITGATTTVSVTGKHTIAEVKAAVEIRQNIPARDQRLMFDGQPLEEHHTIAGLEVPPGGTIFLIVRSSGIGAEFQLDANELAPSFNYDFTNETDDGKVYMRGGKVYKRPYGWKRFAVKVLGVYESDTWLGPDGIRTQQAQGEWPVSYHGTNLQSAKAIMDTGYKKGPGTSFAKAVYSSPAIDMIETYYATEFEFRGNNWKIVLQNRVNPDAGHLTVIPSNDTGVGAEYWLSPKQDADKGVYDVRPYGILFKKVSP